jgi:hypothetical protein
MLNRVQFEGIVLKTWRYGGVPFARLLHRPDPGQNEQDILMTARFNHHAPLDVRKGDLLRVWGFLDNRPMNSSPSSALRRGSGQGSGQSGGNSYVAEIVTEGIVRLGRNQLSKSRRASNNTANTENDEGSDSTAVSEEEAEAVEA